MASSMFFRFSKILFSVSLLCMWSMHTHAFNWEKNGYSWMTGDYNGDGIEDLFVVQDKLMVPITVGLPIIIPVEQAQYVYLGSANGTFTEQTITSADLANVTLTDLPSNRIRMEDMDYDGKIDVAISSPTSGANTMVLYGGDGNVPEVAYEYDAGEDQAVGVFSGSLSVTELGTASYTIPIEVPSYGEGIAPQLALVYNSNSANGELGMGWSIQGLRSSITRCPKTKLYDGAYTPVELNSNDQFCLDGQRLIHMGNNEYRTKAYSNMKVVAHQVDSVKGPLYFNVHTPDGQITLYGDTGIFFGDSSSDGKRFSWPRTNVSFEGQTGWKTAYRVHYNHTPDILYKDIEIKFFYEDRPDSANTVSLGHGNMFSISRRIKRIDVNRLKNLSTYTIASYEISYESVGSLSKSRINSITKKTSDGKALPPIRFEYAQEPGADAGVSSAYISAHFGGARRDMMRGDITSDGVADVFNAVNRDGRILVQMFVGSKTPSALKNLIVSQQIDSSLASISGTRHLSGDFNGDGLTDILRIDDSGATIFETKPFDELKDPSSFSSGAHIDADIAANPLFEISLKHFKPWSSYAIGTSSDIRVADFNADGKDDFIHVVNNEFFHVWLRTENGFFVTTYNPGIKFDSRERVVLGDFNGDGRTDLALPILPTSLIELAKLMSGQATADELAILFSNGDGSFRSHITTPVENRNILFNPSNDDGGIFSASDFNGDGISDIIHAPTGEKPAVFFGKGDGNFEVRDGMFADYAIETRNDRMWFADFNGDGKADILHSPNDEGFHILLSPGLSSSKNNQTQFLPKSWMAAPVYDAIPYGFIFSDYNLDGSIDIAYWNFQHVHTHFGVKDYSRLINRVKTGRKQSVSTDISYGEAAYFDSSISSAPASETRTIKPAWPVVNSVSSNYTLNGDKNSTEYEYGNLRLHWNGGGLLGFDRIKRKDLAAQAEVQTFYSHNVSNFQQGNVLAEKVFDTSGATPQEISSSSTQYDTRIIGDRFHVYAASSTQSGYAKNSVTRNATVNTVQLKPNSFQVEKTTSCVKADSNDNSPCLNTVEESYAYHANASLAGMEPEVYEKRTKRSTNYAVLQMEIPLNSITSSEVLERFTYERGMLKTHTYAPGTDAELKQTYSYDYRFRKPTSVTTTGYGIQSRTASTQYTSAGLVSSKTNALNHTVQFYYDDSIFSWLPTRQVDMNNLTVTTDYDAMGRVYTVSRPDGTVSKTLWDWDWEYDNQGRGIKQIQVQTNAPTVTTYTNFLGQAYRTETYGYSNGSVAEIISTTNYDRLGRVVERLAPNYTLEWDYEPVEKLEYDSLGRIKRRHIPADGVDYTYTFDSSQNQAQVFLNGTLKSTTRYWPTGQTKASIVGPAGTPGITMHYDVFGNLSRSANPNGNQVKIYHDIYGRKTRMDDPDQGTWTYTYYGDRTLKTQTDSKNQVTEMQYDLLGRMTVRIDKNNAGAEVGRSNWYYDAATNGKGMLYKETSSNGFERSFIFDSLGRVEKTTTKIDGSAYQTSATFDAQGRPNTTTYPGGFTTRMAYEPITGVPVALVDHTTGKTLKQFKSYTAAGQLNAYRLGDLINGSAYFNPLQGGRVTDINAWVVGPALVNQRYNWDIEGNLKDRQDVVTGWKEDFGYDALNRLTTVSRSGSATGANVSIQYDALGNITFKSDVGSYAYASGKPHAVTTAGNWTMTYDANGSMITKDGPDIARQTLAYTTFNKPSSIASSDGKTTSFWYGPSRSRFKRQDTAAGQTTTTHYVGSFEKVTGPSGTTERLHVGGNVLVLKTNNVQKINYLIKDHLGSTVAILNEDGTVKERLSYDPWGKRRAPTNLTPMDVWSITVTQLDTNRGYTGHEHIDSMGLIHMNGRVYDPTIGRFLSADPHIQAPGNLQSYNRYAYTLNNPLRYTDPSGYFFKSLVKEFKRFLDKNVDPRTVGNIVTAGMCIAAPGAMCALASAGNAWANGARGDDIWKAGARGGVGSYIGQQVAGYAGAKYKVWTWQNIVGNGIGGGVSSKINGGSFRDGFIGGAFGAAFKPLTFRLFPFGHQGLQRIITAGLIGGTGSYITGGDFGYGAFSGAFGQYWNGERHAGFVETVDPVTGKKMYIHRDYVGALVTQHVPPAVSPNGVVSADGSLFLFIFGGSAGVSTGLDANGNVCVAANACGQFGYGAYIGSGVSYFGGASAMSDGTAGSAGLFFNAGVGKSLSGAIMYTNPGVMLGKGGIGVGTGANVGLQFCVSRTVCR